MEKLRSIKAFIKTGILVASLALGAVISLSWEPLGIASETHEQKPAPSVSPSVSLSVSQPVGSASSESTTQTITEAEKKTLIKEYAKAKKNSFSAFSHQNKSYVKQLQASQERALRAWRNEEKAKRHQYFLDHHSGPDRRVYVQEYIQKKKEYEAQQKAELAKSQAEWAEKLKTFKEQMNLKEQSFNEALQKNIRPSADLWP